MFCNTEMLSGICRRRCWSAVSRVVALSGELTQNERTQALQALRDGRARVCVATDVAARGIDLPNLDLVIHADLPNDAGGDAASLGPHRPCGPQGCQRPAGAAGATAARGIAAQSRWHRCRSGARRLSRRKSASSIRSACCRMPLFTEETTDDDLVLAQALLAERSPEDIAAALARLYRARLPSPEDILDPGQSVAAGRVTIAVETKRPSAARRRSPRPAPIEDRKIIAASRHGGGQRMVPGCHRTKKECGSALAVADDLPPWRHRQAGHRRHPSSGHDDRVRNFRAGRGILRRQDPASGQGRQYPHRAAGGAPPGQAPSEKRSHRLGTKPATSIAARVEATILATRQHRSHAASLTANAGRNLAASRFSGRKRNIGTSPAKLDDRNRQAGHLRKPHTERTQGRSAAADPVVLVATRELWRFRAKACPGLDPGWIPVRVKKTRQNKNLELRF